MADTLHPIAFGCEPFSFFHSGLNDFPSDDFCFREPQTAANSILYDCESDHRIRRYTGPQLIHRAGIVTTGRFCLLLVSIMVKSSINCANAAFEGRSLSSMRNQRLR